MLYIKLGEYWMKGIILAGGAGTRLYPSTEVVCKQLLPIYDKPLIYYPLSLLIQSGIKEILLISTPKDIPYFQKLLGNGSFLGISIEYKVQREPKGIAEAFIVGADFIKDDTVCLILGDNIFHGVQLPKLIEETGNLMSHGKEEATIFCYYVNDPERYGVAEVDESFKIISLEEKPKNPKSNYAVTGLYIYKSNVVDVAKNLAPSARGELEITDVNITYMKRGSLNAHLLGRGYAWLDTGTPASMNDASTFVKIIEEREGLKIGCIEEVAYLKGFISKEKLQELITPIKKSSYGEYLQRILK